MESDKPMKTVRMIVVVHWDGFVLIIIYCLINVKK